MGYRKHLIKTKRLYIITGMEFHSHKPNASSTFNESDEIRIPISQQDIVTAPFESTLYITGTLRVKRPTGLRLLMFRLLIKQLPIYLMKYDMKSGV